MAGSRKSSRTKDCSRPAGRKFPFDFVAPCPSGGRPTKSPGKADRCRLSSSAGPMTGLWTLSWVVGVWVAAALPDGDLCRRMNGRKYYVEAGDGGVVTLRNLTAGEGLPRRCGAELVTRPSCHLTLTVLHLNVSPCGPDGSCGCDYLWIREPAYSQSGREFCGFFSDPATRIYQSETKTVSVDFLYSRSYSDAFSLRFAARENLYRMTGSHLDGPSEAGGILSSPFFPASVPGDYAAEFVLTNRQPDGFVQLLFVDFRLSSRSRLELYDTNGTRIDLYDGNVFRPPAVSSSGPTLGVKFRCDEERPSSGFKAEYSFVNYPDRYWSGKPVTDCGGPVDDFGGALTLANAAEGTSRRPFDCVWLIRPPSGHRGHTRLAVRLAQFRDLGENLLPSLLSPSLAGINRGVGVAGAESSLEIRRGLTSESPLLEAISSGRRRKNSRGREYVVPSSTGFYIRWRGFLGNASYLAITYVSFAYDDCYKRGDFECGNGRCIKHTLRCDGFNHCGDGTDEATCLGNDGAAFNAEEAGRWRTMTPNYYYPKAGLSNGTGTNAPILVVGLAGLAAFILTAAVVLVKLGRRRREHSSPEVLRTVGGDPDGANISENGTAGTSDPPRYDPPPSYEEAVKFYLPPPPAYHPPAGTDDRRLYEDRAEGYANSAFVFDGPDGRADLPGRGKASGGETDTPPILPLFRGARPTEDEKRPETGRDSGPAPSSSSCNCPGACSCPAVYFGEAGKLAGHPGQCECRAKRRKLRRFTSVPLGRSLANFRRLRRFRTEKDPRKASDVSAVENRRSGTGCRRRGTQKRSDICRGVLSAQATRKEFNRCRNPSPAELPTNSVLSGEADDDQTRRRRRHMI
ncbi:uncharacterized protein LOC111635717 isoform X2 [Centruroides sculpturatus]|uniref:uncharacterized protein LOC111635717 isoform X2 n=1 Tax=Centruroides sculpturatus TaxID=218467 RepID=UPI000C6D3077|nr:uncharacterized protein LOC111635717 isoform X2 [Centruroides sculpturatus]